MRRRSTGGTLSRTCHAEADVIKTRLRRTAEDVIEIGLALKRVKAILSDGQLLPWFAAEFDMTPRSAQRFMQVANRFGGKYDTVSLFAPPAAIDELAAPPTRHEIVAEASLSQPPR